MKRAVVLGGGGAVGVAWEMSIVAGLLDGGLDLREADLFVGTSAGSVVGTHTAHGRDLRDTVRELGNPPETAPSNDAYPRDVASVTAAFQLWGSFDAMDDAACAAVGRMALDAKTMPEDAWLAGFAQNEFDRWPQKPLVMTAVDCHSGAFRPIDASQGIPIDVACAASCSVPGLFPPVTIEGRRYTDGGVRSFTSADLALAAQPEVVLIIAVFGVIDRGVHALAARQLARETAQIEATGASVRVIQMDEAAQAACGMNLMDPALRVPTAEAGMRHARSLAPELLHWWNGAATG